ncbi:MAG: hypothetical protein PHG00_17150 [Methylococcales bacterium]|nr:hypothetical protein [Methylococcales bacterium]
MLVSYSGMGLWIEEYNVEGKYNKAYALSSRYKVVDVFKLSEEDALKLERVGGVTTEILYPSNYLWPGEKAKRYGNVEGSECYFALDEPYTFKISDIWQEPLLPEPESKRTDKAKGGSKGERDLTKWLKETWLAEGKPEGANFFNCLKKYKNKKGSPITDYWTASINGPGFKWSTGNASGERTKKTVQTRVSCSGPQT